jgi:hypothetical protein
MAHTASRPDAATFKAAELNFLEKFIFSKRI